MKPQFVRFYKFWIGLSYFKYIIFTIIIGIIFTLPIGLLLYGGIGLTEDDIKAPEFDNWDKSEVILIAVIIAPILETLLLQLIPIKIIQRMAFKRHSNKIAVIVSTFVFAFSHISYSFWYFLLMLPMGFVLAVTYIAFKNKKQSSFWTTAIVHAGRNGVAIVATFL